MREADFFQPKMDASAAHRDPGAGEPNIVDAQEETSGSDNDEGNDALKKEKLQNPETFQETVLGLDESHGNDPLRQFMTLQKRMQIVQEEGDKLMRRQSRYHHHEKSDELNTSIQAGSEQCKQYLLEVRDIAKQMIANDESNDMHTASFLKKIGAANESADDIILARAAEPSALLGAGEPENTNIEKGLNIRAGKPMSMLSHAAWVLSFVEFSYGDCAPMQQRPHKLSLEKVFQFLLQREELEYTLETDTQIYKARAMSRWDTPEFVMVFASALRSLKMLTASKFAIFGSSQNKQSRDRAVARFKRDLDAIAKAKAEDFERALAYVNIQHNVPLRGNRTMCRAPLFVKQNI